MQSSYEIIGQGGQHLKDAWETDNPSAYIGSMVPGFPNFFTILGPNVGLGHGGSMIKAIELQTSFILSIISRMFDRNAQTVAVTAQAHESYNVRMTLDTADDDTRGRIKRAAIRLFARQGIDGVSVRAILTAADVKNSAGIHYYFRTKDVLIGELVSDALTRTRRARNAALDALEASGAPISVRDVVNLICKVETTETNDPEARTDLPIGFGHMRFISVMQLNHRDKFTQAVEAEGDDSFERCIAHIAKALTEVPRAVLNQRIVFFYQFAQASLSAREAAFVQTKDGGKLWSDPNALENLIDSLTAGLICPGHPA